MSMNREQIMDLIYERVREIEYRNVQTKVTDMMILDPLSEIKELCLMVPQQLPVKIMSGKWERSK